MKRSYAVVCILCQLLLAPLGMTPPDDSSDGSQPPGRPRILVSNDDGIDSPGLRTLVHVLSTFADVYVSAPNSNRSGSSQSLTYLSTVLNVQEVSIEGAIAAMSVDGTPADAVHFGLVHFGAKAPFDLVLSGMNRGANLGDLSHGSGTVGAAMQGASQGVPSIAVSTDGRLRDLDAAAQFALRFAKQVLDHDSSPDTVYSINIPRPQPDGTWRGVRVARMGGNYLPVESYRPVEAREGNHAYRAVLSRKREFPFDCDTQAYFDGYIAITPLRFDWTDQKAIGALNTWDLSISE